MGRKWKWWKGCGGKPGQWVLSASQWRCMWRELLCLRPLRQSLLCNKKVCLTVKIKTKFKTWWWWVMLNNQKEGRDEGGGEEPKKTYNFTKVFNIDNNFWNKKTRCWRKLPCECVQERLSTYKRLTQERGAGSLVSPLSPLPPVESESDNDGDGRKWKWNRAVFPYPLKFASSVTFV